jgi:tRNA-2-methylthio-N6-dimethylallyladenosine synthase
MTLDILQRVKYDGAYMFKYSPREGTKAYSMEDDVPEEAKIKRLNEIIDLQQKISFELNQQLIGKEEVVLVEGCSKKSDKYLSGRTDTNKVVIFPHQSAIKVGDYVKIKINKATSATLFGDFITTIDQINYDISNTA